MAAFKAHFGTEPAEGLLAVADVELYFSVQAGSFEAFEDEVFELVVEFEGVEVAVGGKD